MATYFVGGEFDSFFPMTATDAFEETGNAQTGISRGSIYVQNSGKVGAYLINPSTQQRTSATGTIWFHSYGYWYGCNTNTPQVPFTYVNSNNVPVFRFITTGSGNPNYQCQMSVDGNTWTNLGGVMPLPVNASWTLDLMLTIGTSGALRVFGNGVEVLSVANVDTSAMLNVARWEGMSNRNDANALRWSQVIIADYPTIGHVVRRRTPTGNGTSVGWNGDYTGVDEFQTSDGDGVTTNVAGQKETFTAAALSATESGKVIKAVAVAARVRTDEASVPKTVKAVIRVGSTDYESAPMVGTNNYTYGGSLAIWEKDPSTNADWANITNVNGEFGIKSDT